MARLDRSYFWAQMLHKCLESALLCLTLDVEIGQCLVDIHINIWLRVETSKWLANWCSSWSSSLKVWIYPHVSQLCRKGVAGRGPHSPPKRAIRALDTRRKPFHIAIHQQWEDRPSLKGVIPSHTTLGPLLGTPQKGCINSYSGVRKVICDLSSEIVLAASAHPPPG